MSTNPIIISCIIAYIVAMAVIGLYLTHKKVKNSDDFAVADRSLPTVVLIGTLLATWCGAGGPVWHSGLYGRSYRNDPAVSCLRPGPAGDHVYDSRIV